MLIPIVRVATIVLVSWTPCHEVMFYLVFSVLFWRRSVGIAAITIWMLASVWSLFLTRVTMFPLPISRPFTLRSA